MLISTCLIWMVIKNFKIQTLYLQRHFILMRFYLERKLMKVFNWKSIVVYSSVNADVTL